MQEYIDFYEEKIKVYRKGYKCDIKALNDEKRMILDLLKKCDKKSWEKVDAEEAERQRKAR